MKNLIRFAVLSLFAVILTVRLDALPMSGTYSIGPTGTYTTFSAAVVALVANHVSGPVLFNVQAGTYNERVFIPAISGASATNVITFSGVNKYTVLLRYSPSGLQSTLVLDGADHIRFENISIISLGTTSGRALFLKSQADSNRFSNCRMVTDSTGTTSTIIGIECGSNESSVGTTGNSANGNIFENNIITGGYYGMYMSGTGTTQLCNNNVISGNSFINQYIAAIYINYQRNLQFSRNQMTIGIRYAAAYGGYIFYCQRSVLDGNIIKSGQTGIYFYGENMNSTSDSSLVINNMVNGFTNPNTQTGLNFNFTYNMRVYHNSISLNGLTANAYYCTTMLFSNSNDIIIRNNILQSTAGTLLLSFYPSPGGKPAVIEGNDYLHLTSGNSMFYNNGVYYTTLTNWKLNVYAIYSPHDLTSVENADPHFVSVSDLHINPAYAPVRGFPLWLTTDADGDARCVYEPTLGADESRYSGTAPSSLFYGPDSTCFPGNVDLYNMASPTVRNGYSWYVNRVLKATTFDYTAFFNKKGLDTVSLITANCYGKDTLKQVIVVDGPKTKSVPDFISTANHARPSENITLIDMSSDCPSSWKWEISPTGTVSNPAYHFATGFSDTSQSPVIIFNFTGKYDVCLTVTNAKGKSSKLCRPAYLTIEYPDVMCGSPANSTQMFGTLHDDIEGAGYQSVVSNTSCNFFLNSCSDTLLFVLNFLDIKANDYLRIYDDSNSLSRKPLWNITAFPNGMGNGMNTMSAGYQDSFTSFSGKMFFIWDRHGIGYSSTYLPGGFIGSWEAKPLLSPQKSIAKFTCPDTVCLNKAVNFTNLSTGRNLTYYWTFTGSSTSVLKNPQFSFTTTGNYLVKLKISGCGGDSSYSRYVTVVNSTKAPRPDFTANLIHPVKGVDIVGFTDLTKGCVDSWEWVISPNSYSVISGFPNSASPYLIFDSTVCYDVKLIAGNNGFYDTIVKKCYIKPVIYCIPVISSLNTDIGISLVKMETINNTSSVGIDPYTNYTATQSANVVQGTKYKIKINRNSVSSSMNRKVWVDYNLDGDFDDSNEMVLYEPPAKTISWDTAFEISYASLPGITRMRIGTSAGTGTNLSCGVNPIGEFEDYRLIILADTTRPHLSLIGKDTVYVVQCQVFNDPGAIAYRNSANAKVPLTNIITTNSVNTSITGLYIIKYKISAPNGLSDSVYRNVIVTPDTSHPVITLYGASDTIIEVFHSWVEPGYTAVSPCTGIKTSSLTGTVNTSITSDYILQYSATNFNNKTTVIKRTVRIRDKTAPTGSLKGGDTIMILVYTKFTDPGLNVSDNYDPSPIISRTGSVDTTILGFNSLVYKITDHSGNSSVTFNRVVEVIDSLSPVVTMLGSTSVNLCRYETLSPAIDSALVSDNYDKVAVLFRSGTYINDYLPNRRTGNYSLVYTARDGSGNLSVPVTRTVKVIVCPANSVEADKISGIRIFPNPANGYFEISSSIAGIDHFDVELINLMGEKMNTTITEKGSATYEVNTSGLASGIYLVRVRANGLNEIKILSISR